MFYAKRPVWMGVISLAASVIGVGLGIGIGADFESLPLFSFILVEILFAVPLVVLGIILFVNVKRGYIEANDEGVTVFNGFGRKKFFPYREMVYCGTSMTTTRLSRFGSVHALAALLVYDKEGVLLFKCDSEFKPEKLRELLLEKGVKSVASEPLFPPPTMRKGRALMKSRNYAPKMLLCAIFAYIFLGMTLLLIPVYSTLGEYIPFFWIVFASGIIPFIILLFYAIKRRRLKRDAEGK